MLQYIFGGSSSGKTTYCIEDMIAKSKNNNDKYIYITPEQYTLESERNIVKKSENSAIMKIQVLSFGRLSYHVFTGCGFSSKEVLDDLGKNMLLRKLIFDIKDELLYFGNNTNKNGFIEELSDTLNEFVKYKLNNETLVNISENVDRKSLSLKLKDLCLINSKFEDYIKDKYILAEKTLDMLSFKIQEGVCNDYFENCHIYIDAFYGFTPQEFDVIDKMMGIVKSINIAMYFDGFSKKGVRFDKIGKNDVTGHIKYTINDITDLAKKNNIDICEPIYLEGNYKSQDAQDLKHLSENYFKYAVDEAYSENIQIIQAVNTYDEMEFVAKKIASLVRCENSFDGLRYRDIGVIGNGLSEIELIIKDIFSSYEIPHFIDANKDVAVHPLVEFVKSLFTIIATNYTYEAVFAFLKTGLTQILPHEIDKFENYVLKYGIKGQMYLKEWEFGNDDIIKSVNNSRKILVSFVKPLKECFSKKENATTICSVLFGLLEKNNVTHKLELWSNDEELRNHLKNDNFHVAIWDKIVSVFEKIVDVLGNEILEQKEFLGIIEAGLATVKMGNIPPSLDEVIIGEIERSRLPEVKVLFMVGVNEGNLPRKYVEKGFLTDDDRVSMLETGIVLSPSIHSLILRQQFLIYSALTKPSNMLFVSFSQSDANGKTLEPSPIIRKIKNIFANLEIKETNSFVGNEIAGIKEPVFEKIVYLAREENKNETYEYFKNNEEYSERLEKIEMVYKSRMNYDKLSKEIVENIYSKEILTSVSRLEQYSKCPFMHFANYDLKLKQREIYNLEIFDIGDIFHKILEEYIGGFEKDEDISPSNFVYDENKIADIIEEVLSNVKNDIFSSTGAYEYIGNRLKKIAKTSIWALYNHIQKGDFKIHASEYDFTNENPITAINIKINNEQSFILRGKIDRIDILDKDDNKYVKIIDYKSGKKKIDYSDIYSGMQLQLITYLNSFIKLANNYNGANNLSTKFVAGGVFYFNLSLPVISEDKLGSYDEKNLKEKVEELILDEFKLEGVLLNDVDVVRGMDKDIEGTSKIIPVKTKDEDGILTILERGSKVLRENQFSALGDFITDKISDIGKEMVSGEIKPRPFKKGKSVACEYCEYGSVCGFETLEIKNKYNVVKKIGSVDEIIKGNVTVEE